MLHPKQAAEERRCAACGGAVVSGEHHRCPLLSMTAGNSIVGATEPGPGEPDEDPALLVGRTLGERYELVEVIGSGATGVVFRARHTVLGSDVAVKLLRGRGLPSQRERFLKEARVASQLRHPNIVYIFDFGLLLERRPYLVMELLPGRTLAAAIAQGRMAPARACRIALQIARGLQAMHDRGIVHRDLKPAAVASERAPLDPVPSGPPST
ncbi:MAG: serine/threonine-protein kinase [Polyangia bacterium]